MAPADSAVVLSRLGRGKAAVNDQNPYQSPAEASTGDAPQTPPQKTSPAGVLELPVAKPAVSTSNTILPRHLAAALDNLLAMVLALVAAKLIDSRLVALQLVVVVVVYLGYFLLSEALFARTPGKLLMGLVVIQFSGAPCTFRQTLIRTGFRLLEVNPTCFGGIPAALAVVTSPHRQRFGDRTADTIVVSSARWKKWRAAHPGR